MAITYNNLYMDIRQIFRGSGIDAATLEARELMCYASGKSREELQRDARLYVPQAIEQRVRELVRRHLAGEPVAYLIGEWEFYGLPLDIDVYDLAEWCALAELGALSMDNGCAAVAFPDFTRGGWNRQQGYRHAYASPEDEMAAEKAARESTARQKEMTVKKKLWEKYDKNLSPKAVR